MRKDRLIAHIVTALQPARLIAILLEFGGNTPEMRGFSVSQSPKSVIWGRQVMRMKGRSPFKGRNDRQSVFAHLLI